MKLESFKFQDGKVFWLPEYPEKEVKKCENACEYCEYVCADYYEYRKAVTKSLASAIEVAPEDADVVKIQIWWHNIWTPGLDKQHANQNTFNQIIELWQSENGKVYNAECEMEIGKQGICCSPMKGGINHHGYCDECPNYTEHQVARLKSTKEHLPKRDTSSRDWPEYFDDENGNYQNKCCRCKLLFYGNKHRVICKECDAAANSHDMKDYDL